jgi:hypothetical protein
MTGSADHGQNAETRATRRPEHDPSLAMRHNTATRTRNEKTKPTMRLSATESPPALQATNGEIYQDELLDNGQHLGLNTRDLFFKLFL